MPDDATSIDLDAPSEIERPDQPHVVADRDGPHRAPAVAWARDERRVVDHRPPLVHRVRQPRRAEIDPPGVAPRLPSVLVVAADVGLGKVDTDVDTPGDPLLHVARMLDPDFGV